MRLDLLNTDHFPMFVHTHTRQAVTVTLFTSFRALHYFLRWCDINNPPLRSRGAVFVISVDKLIPEDFPH